MQESEKTKRHEVSFYFVIYCRTGGKITNEISCSEPADHLSLQPSLTLNLALSELLRGFRTSLSRSAPLDETELFCITSITNYVASQVFALQLTDQSMVPQVCFQWSTTKLDYKLKLMMKLHVF